MKKIVLLNTGEVFKSAREAAKKYNVGFNEISFNALNKRKSTGKLNGESLVFAFKDDYDKMSQEEIKEKISIAQNPLGGKNHYDAKAVINLENGQVFETIKECAKHYNISAGNLSQHLLGRRKHVGGMTFQYYKNEKL